MLKRSVIVVSVVSVLLGSIATSIPLAAPAAAATSWPVKIFSVNTPATKIGAALANPYVAGISVRFSWAAIEPAKGSFKWGAIDKAISQARKAGKRIMIRVLAGIYTPSWVLSRVKTLTFANTYLYSPSAYPSAVTMPIPWRSKYLWLWNGFVAALGHRYNGNGTIYSIQMPGCGFIGEMTLPTDVTKWLNHGYTDAKYIACWDGLIGDYRKAFPNTRTSLDIVEPFPQNLLSTNVVSPVVKYATKAGSRKARIQNNALRAGMLGTIGPYRQAIRKASSVTKVGYQMIGTTNSASELHDAFTVAIQDQVSYVEVYASDVLDSANQSTLKYLASDGTQ